MSTRLQFIWHFHQPYYGIAGKDPETFYLPWVRLHAIKAYYDMARMLERHPEIRATANFSGSLLRQLRSYVDEGIRDTWWELSLKPADELSDHDKRHILKHFFSIDHRRCIRPHERYAELLAARGNGTEVERFSVRDYRDLQVWFNLAWFGFSAREDRPLLQELIEKGSDFTEIEKEAVLEQQIDVMQLVVPLWRDLHRRGQIEISVTPMFHPILPLLIDSDSAKRATPSRPVPRRFMAPDHANLHVHDARSIAREFLAVDIDGMWPAEGSVSPEAVDLFRRAEVDWIGTDADVLKASRGSEFEPDDASYGWQLGGIGPAIFFRDHELSDRIGFVYKDNDPAASAEDFVSRVKGREGVITVAVDGENPWEHFPNDGRDFLDALYRHLVQEEIRTVVPSEYEEVPRTLSRLHSGSWIMANYQIWIGHSETNAAWNFLGDAQRALRDAMDENRIDSPELAIEALMIAEGSDWFWWFGDDFSSENDLDFDRLFRENLAVVYREIGEKPPEELSRPISKSRVGSSFFTAPTDLIDPTIDGKTDYFYEWAGAGIYRNSGSHGSMFELLRFINEIHIGFDLENIFIRVELAEDGRSRAEDLQLKFIFATPSASAVVVVHGADGGYGEVVLDNGSPRTLLDVALDENFEIAIPNPKLGLNAGDIINLACVVLEGDVQLERHPPTQFIEFEIPDASFEGRHWMV